MLVVFPIEVQPEGIVNSRGRGFGAFAADAFQKLAVAFLEALRQFIRFRLAAPPVNDFRIERRCEATTFEELERDWKAFCEEVKAR